MRTVSKTKIPRRASAEYKEMGAHRKPFAEQSKYKNRAGTQTVCATGYQKTKNYEKHQENLRLILRPVF